MDETILRCVASLLSLSPTCLAILPREIESKETCFMPIKLSVIGIFFGTDLPFETDTHVVDVLKAASSRASSGLIPNVSDFSFEITNPPKASAISFSATYTGMVQGRAIGQKYPAGEYFLAEGLSARPAYNVWQYYVLNADQTPVSRGVKFLDDPAAIVPAGGSLIWRLVSILPGPNPRSPMAKARMV
jgi:hypothetical protein